MNAPTQCIATAKHSLDLAINELRECLSTASGIESLHYLSVIEEAAALRGRIAALHDAAQQDQPA